MTRVLFASFVAAAVGYLAGAMRPTPRPSAPVVETRVVRVPTPIPASIALPAHARAEPEPPQRRPEPASEHRAAVEVGRALVARVLAAGRLVDEDAAALRALLPRLEGADDEELMATLLPAINDGRVLVATDGPPF
jgi:hypothetical protein